MNCLTQKSVGLKKSLNEYTCSDIPQLHEEIAEKYSDLLGPLPLKLPPFFYCNIFVYVESGAGCMRVYIDGALVFVHAGCD